MAVDEESEGLPSLVSPEEAMAQLHIETPASQPMTDTMTQSDMDLQASTTSLHYAAGSGDLEQLQVCLQPGEIEQFDLESSDSYGRTPLTYTVLANAPACTEALLRAGVNIGTRDGEGRTALHWAALQGNHKMLKLLLERNADVATLDNESRTPLHMSMGAGSSKCCKLLLKAAIAPDELVNTPDKDHMCAQHWCAFHNHHKHMDLLIAYGADLMLRDAEGKLPIHWTAANEDAKTLSRILDDFPDSLNEPDNEGRTVVHLAVAERNIPISEVLLQFPGVDLSLPDTMLRSPLHWVTVLGYVEMANALIQLGADVDMQDENGSTALHFATQNQTTECLEVLLNCERTQDIPDSEGRTALMWAAGSGNEEAVKLLTSYGYDIHNADKMGGTALHAAAYSGSAECTSALLECNAIVDPLDSMLHTPLFRACENGKADAAITLLKAGAAVGNKDVDTRTALHWASLGGFDYITRLLLDAQADVNVVESQGRTPLQCAAYGGYTEVMSALCEYGARVNARDAEGICALHWAASTGHLDAVKLLVDRGADLNVMEADGAKLTPLDYAAIGDGEGTRHEPVVDYLLSKGAISISTIREIAAMTIQDAWRDYMDVLKGNSKQKPRRGARARRVVARAMYRNNQKGEKKTRENTEHMSTVELERLKREERKKQRETEDEARKAAARSETEEEEYRLQQRQSVLLTSSRLREARSKEEQRIAQIRGKQRAASTIQVWYRAMKRREAEETNGRRSKSKGYKIQSRKLRQSGISTADAQNYNHQVAALTIQLYWRQYQRRLIETRKKNIRTEDFTSKAAQQRVRMAGIYTTKTKVLRYVGVPPSAMTRPYHAPASLSSTLAENSFKFAVRRYGNVHMVTRPKQPLIVSANRTSHRRSPTNTNSTSSTTRRRALRT
eukprot:m.50583 g.50583  ORF g.50583 m.50583 type:complete len:904 (+) comp10680_c0_seq1:266-2977(+)